MGDESTKRGPPLDNSYGAPSLTFRLARKKNCGEETVHLFQRETISRKNIFSSQRTHGKNDFAKLDTENNFV